MSVEMVKSLIDPQVSTQWDSQKFKGNFDWSCSVSPFSRRYSQTIEILSFLCDFLKSPCAPGATRDSTRRCCPRSRVAPLPTPAGLRELGFVQDAPRRAALLV